MSEGERSRWQTLGTQREHLRYSASEANFYAPQWFGPSADTASAKSRTSLLFFFYERKLSARWPTPRFSAMRPAAERRYAALGAPTALSPGTNEEQHRAADDGVLTWPICLSSAPGKLWPSPIKPEGKRWPIHVHLNQTYPGLKSGQRLVWTSRWNARHDAARFISGRVAPPPS